MVNRFAQRFPQVWALLLVLVFPCLAQAQAVVHVEGKDAKKIRSQINRLVPKKLGQANSRTFAQQMGGELGVRINKRGKRGSLIEEIQDAGGAAGASLVVVARVMGKSVHVLAVDVASGSVELDKNISIAKKSRRRKKRRGIDTAKLKAALRPVFANANPTPPPSSAPVAATPSGDAKSTEGGADWGAPSWAGDQSSQDGDKTAAVDSEAEGSSTELTAKAKPRRRKKLGPENAFMIVEPVYSIGGRRLSYTNQRTDNLRPYESMGISMIGARAELYPFALLDSDTLSMFGVGGSYGRALGLSSSPKDNKQLEITTKYDTFDINLRGRIPLGSAALLVISAGYQGQKFVFSVPDAQAELRDEVPAANYRFIRVGVGGRVGFGPMAVYLGAGYRNIRDSGRIGQRYFPKSALFGLDAQIGAGYRILDFMEARAIFDYNRINYTLNPEADSAYQADNAADQFFGLNLGAALMF